MYQPHNKHKINRTIYSLLKFAILCKHFLSPSAEPFEKCVKGHRLASSCCENLPTPLWSQARKYSVEFIWLWAYGRWPTTILNREYRIFIVQLPYSLELNFDVCWSNNSNNIINNNNMVFIYDACGFFYYIYLLSPNPPFHIR